MIAAALVAALWLQVAPPPQPSAIVREIRVHGNATLSDAAVIALAGIQVGAPLEPGGTDTIARRLRATGRFDSVEVRQRYRTLEMDELALVLLVHEKPGISLTGQPPSLVRRIRSRLMFFPILQYEDGYGWTYGGMTSTINLLGEHERISVPLSWGGNKRAALEADRTFTSGPFTRVSASYGIDQRDNPHFGVDDRRVTVSGRAERRLFDLVTIGGSIGREDVHFSPVHDRLWTGEADIAVDTRKDQAFPIDAVYALASAEQLHATGGATFAAASPVTRYRVDGRVYKRLYRQVIGAGRLEYDTADAPLPAYDEWLLGGATLRGIRPGMFAGDTRLIWSGELRVPITSPIHDFARLGVDAFTDGGKSAAFGQRLGDIRADRTAGAGIFLIATLIQLNLDVAHSLDGRGTRVHFSTGFTF